MRRPEYAGGVQAPSLLFLAACLSLPLLFAGCGYSTGFVLPEGTRTIAVPIFRNETFPLRRDLEVELTRAVKRELQLRTDARVVADRASADAVLEGIILDFSQGVLAEGADDEVQESGIVVRVRIRLIRARDGSELVGQTDIREDEPYSNVAGETIDLARGRVVEELARSVVIALEPWESPGL